MFPSRLGAALRFQLSRYLGRPASADVEQIAFRDGSVAIDAFRLLPDGTATITGWTLDLPALASSVLLRQGEASRPAVASWSIYRPDVQVALRSVSSFHGFELHFARLDRSAGRDLHLLFRGTEIFRTRINEWREPPHYDALNTSVSVFSREQIYASGPPAHTATDESLALALALPGPVLDFGCGAGYLVGRMRKAGIEAFGVEIDRDAIRTALPDDIRPFVRLTDGTLPLPYSDGEFESAIATEVLEHIDNPTAAVAEIARVTRKRVVITVPDASAIPALFYANVVPWHLLESTHFQFFNVNSLKAMLEPYFSRIEMLKIGRCETDGIPWFTSIAAICEK